MVTWEELKSACMACSKCRLCETRTNVVFGDGNPGAEVLFIGEGPGEQEDLTGLPFVGRAGKLLDAMLASIGLEREQVYIANIVKCRPPQNRDPLPAEAEACMPWLLEQIRLVNPRIIVCLGRVAACRLIRPDFKISVEHGSWHEFEGRKITATYHPAALLRDPSRRGDAFEDLRKTEEELTRL